MIETTWSVATNEIAENGMRFVRDGTDAECKALASSLDIVGCGALRCDLRIRPLRQGRYHVAGRIQANVTQACIVSLDPVDSSFDEAIDVEFWPRDQIAVNTRTEGEGEFFDPDASDDAEAIDNGRLAIGQLVYETIAAGLDPYPRRAGAELQIPDKLKPDASIHPFAALAKLQAKK